MIGKQIKIILCKLHKKEILLSLAIGLFMLFASYEATNMYWPWNGGEKMKLQICEWVKQKITQRNYGDDMLDSVMAVNVHYDKVLALVYDDGLPKGKIAVTDHHKLLTFLKKLKEYDNYKYVLLDLYFENNITQDADEELINVIQSMDRIVIPLPLDGLKRVDKRLLSKAAMAKYGSTLWENDFVKYPYFSDGMKSIPLKMYEDITGRHISDYSIFAWDKGLARKNVMLTYEFRENDTPYLLGLGILGDTIAGNKTNGIIDKPDKFKDKYILIGDFEEDRHVTFIGEMSGTSINFNAFISLLHGKHRPKWLMIMVLFGVFSLMVYLTLRQRGVFFAGFLGYGTLFFIFCIVLYLLYNEVYEIIILSALYAVLKKCVENNWYKSTIKNMKKRLFTVLLLLFCCYISPATHAEQYKIIELFNCSSIKIGNRILKENSVFDGGETIYWKSSAEAMRVEDGSGVKRVYSKKGFEKYKATSLINFLTKEKGLAGRSLKGNNFHYRNRVFCLADSLHFRVKQEPDSILIAEAVWNADNKQVVTKIQRTKDNLFYIITPEIFGDQMPRDILLNIRERDEDYQYIDNVYRGIQIIYIPLKK